MKRKKWIILAAALVLLGLAAGLGTLWSPWKSEAVMSYEGQLATVTRGMLPVTVNEAGEIEAATRTVIANEMRSPAIISYVIPDGTYVTKGTKIIEFECSELEDTINKQVSVVDAARVAADAGQKNLELKKDEMTEKVRKAVEALKDANEDLKRFDEGEWPIKWDKAQSEIQLAERDLSLAQDKLNFKLKVNSEMKQDSPYSAKDIEADKIGVDRLQLTLKGKIAEKEMLEKYDHAKDLRKLSGAVRDAELALKRAELENGLQVALAKGDAEGKQYLFEQAQKELTRARDEYAKRIRLADSDGLVVYDPGNRGWTKVTVAVGEKIDSRTQLLIIPNMETLRAKTQVYEAVSEQVEVGQKAYVRLDSRPDVVLAGEVESVATLPSKQDSWLNPDVKVFEVHIKLNNKVEGLKPNLTARIEIVLAELKDVLRVPVAAVFVQQEETFCWRMVDGKPQRTAIQIGRMNDTMAEVTQGLKEGDQVMLKPPEGAASGKGIRSGSATRPAAGRKIAATKPVRISRLPSTSQAATTPAAPQPASPSRPAESMPASAPGARQERTK